MESYGQCDWIRAVESYATANAWIPLQCLSQIVARGVQGCVIDYLGNADYGRVIWTSERVMLQLAGEIHGSSA